MYLSLLLIYPVASDTGRSCALWPVLDPSYHFLGLDPNLISVSVSALPLEEGFSNKQIVFVYLLFDEFIYLPFGAA